MNASALRSGLRAVPSVFGLLLLLPLSAAAHTGAGPVHGLIHGFLHPVLGWDHLLAMVAVGLWAAQGSDASTRRSRWVLPATFVGVMIAGGLLGAARLPLPGVEAGILLSVLVLGGLVAAAVRLPIAASVGLVGLFALFHGHAHGAEMPAALPGIAYGAGFAAATALLHAGGVLLALRAERTWSNTRFLGPEPVRVAGVAVLAGGLCGLLLTLL